MSEIRPLTRKRDPDAFLPVLQKSCAECGVAVAVVRAPQGCRASGATRFTGRAKALLQLSFRYLTDDHFWFTFFHEAAHLLLHSHAALFLEGVAPSSTKEEEEANEFAAGILIPKRYTNELLALRADHHQILRFAKKAGVSPGIVVGQLQHRKLIKQDHLNGLKRHFQWH
ncbi:MAG TPA: ImmA/IrrE family metallo-endopeptidase [Planctomycetaceae bacterium]|nr:ImmA/IrrE family metallo-endopeptidase [Planctomycetaceae bacterium]